MESLNVLRPFPERFTDDFFRDRLPELEFRLEEARKSGPTHAPSSCLTWCLQPDSSEERHASRAISRRRILENAPACATCRASVASMTCSGTFTLEVSYEVHDLILKGANKNAPLDKELKTPPLDTSRGKFCRRTLIFACARLMIACQLGWLSSQHHTLHDGQGSTLISARVLKLPRFHLVKWLVEFEGVDMDGPISRCGFRAIDYAGKARANREVRMRAPLLCVR